MSFKGIAWAGNVYEKFEAMCLEVEEAMYKDTVKYMENQAQKVGDSMKKFYSEVVKDLGPLSCIDPMSLASDDLSHGYIDANKNPTPNTLKNDDEDQDNGKPYPTANLLSPQSPGVLIENKPSEESAASKKIGVNRRPIGIKRISRNNHPLKESSRDRRSDMETSSSLPLDNKDVMSLSDLNRRFESRESVEGNSPTIYNSIESPASVETSPSESVRQGSCDDTNVTSSSEVVKRVEGKTHFCSNLIESSTFEGTMPDESVRQMNDASDNESLRVKGDSKTTSSCRVLNEESTGASTKEGSSSYSSPCNIESCDEDFIAAECIPEMDDGFEIEFVENHEIVPEMKMEESCILVEGDELQFSLQGAKKHKSYKRRIREALSSKLKSKKEDEFVSEFEGGEKKQALPVRGVDCEKHKLDGHNSVESDWELL